MRINQKKLDPFEETAVIVYSEEDQAWVAHGLRTDQVGVGNGIAVALADLIKAIDQICEEAAADETIAYLREAPPEIQGLYQSAKHLPKEIYEVAHKMARGEWPKDIDADFRPENSNTTFTADVHADLCPA